MRVERWERRNILFVNGLAHCEKKVCGARKSPGSDFWSQLSLQRLVNCRRSETLVSF
jgi:hypothetical protein